MNKSDLALFLGMICGDGCLTIRTRKEGYKTYAIEFYNTNLDKINNFLKLFQELFEINGKISCEIKERRKKLYVFRSYSKKVFYEISSLGFPIGLKKYTLKIPPVIWELNKNEKMSFLKGILITDGSIRKNGNALFHMASGDFITDLSDLIYELFGLRKEVKRYMQKGKYSSYQLFLDKKFTQEVLNQKV